MQDQLLSEESCSQDLNLKIDSNVPDHAQSESEKEIIRQKCYRFTQWCKKVGIICPKIDYPGFFEGGLVGAKVNSPIAHREAFLFVPQSAIISLDKCLAHPQLAPIYSQNKNLFTNQHNDWE